MLDHEWNAFHESVVLIFNFGLRSRNSLLFLSSEFNRILETEI
jgi:hypothetical protein